MPKTHCWKDYHEFIGDVFGWGSDKFWEHFTKPSATCMLPACHPSDHEWTNDSDIGVTFAPAESVGVGESEK